jgi:hypothetical protein
MPDVKVDFIRASSYGAASESSGNVTVQHAGGLAKWEGYHILLVRRRWAVHGWLAGWLGALAARACLDKG